jgi:hypothetical protein
MSVNASKQSGLAGWLSIMGPSRGDDCDCSRRLAVKLDPANDEAAISQVAAQLQHD